MTDNKINLKEKLNYLWNVYMIDYKRYAKIYEIEVPKKLTCKELAKLCNVTQATLSNLNEDSKFSLLYLISEEIYLYYDNFFHFQTERNKINKEEDGSFTMWNIMQVLQYITEK